MFGIRKLYQYSDSEPICPFSIGFVLRIETDVEFCDIPSEFRTLLKQMYPNDTKKYRGTNITKNTAILLIGYTHNNEHEETQPFRR